MKQFLDTVPDDIFEAGKIDGASEWQLYTKIAIPLLRNAQATVIILTFGGIWADTATSTTYIYKEQLRTLGFFMNTDWRRYCTYGCERRIRFDNDFTEHHHFHNTAEPCYGYDGALRNQIRG